MAGLAGWLRRNGLHGKVPLGLMGIALAHFLWLASDTASAAARIWVTRILLAAIAPVVLTLIWRAAATPGLDVRTRLAWRLFALAGLLLFLGNAVFLLGDLGGNGAGRFAPIGWLAYYPVLFAALLAFPRVRRSRGERLRFWIDTAIVLVGGAMVLWALVLGPAAARAPTAPAPATWWLALAYPLGDVVLLFGIALIALRRRDEPERWSFGLLAAGLAMEFAGDLAYGVQNVAGTYEAGSFGDSAYVFAWCLRGWSADAFRSLRREAEPGSTSPLIAWSALPYAVVVGAALAVVAGWRGGDRHVLAELLLAGGVLTALVLARQIVTVRENLRLSAAEEAGRREARFRGLIQHSADAIVVLDFAGRVHPQTPSVERVLGLPASAIAGRPWHELVQLADLPRARALLAQAAAVPGAAGPVELRLAHPERGHTHVEMIAHDLSRDPEVGGMVLTLRDISDRKSLEAELQHRAFHDPLTGLPNRELLCDRLEQARNRARQHGHPYALILLGLDDFRLLSERHGHAAGDRALVEIAGRLAAAVSAVDTAARFGGDEFAVLLESADAAAARAMAARVAAAVAVAPLRLGEAEAHVTASLGLAVAEQAELADERHRGEELLRRAELAMLRAKELGKGRLEVYTEAIRATAHQRRQATAELRAALEHGDLEVHFQAIVHLASGRIAGAEALARWRHAGHGGLVPPAEFVSLAEQAGLIVELGRVLRAETFRRAAAWPPGRETEPLLVGVNISAVELHEPDLVDELAAALAAAGLPPDRLVVEITETAIARDIATVLPRVQDLAVLGVRLAMDDFGTGYSSLSRLDDLPIRILKLDQSFVRGLAPGTESPLVRGVIGLGRAMGLVVVAEGVETVAQAAALVGLGCRFGQGYHLARPLPAAEFEHLLRREVEAASTLRARPGAVERDRDNLAS